MRKYIKFFVYGLLFVVLAFILLILGIKLLMFTQYIAKQQMHIVVSVIMATILLLLALYIGIPLFVRYLGDRGLFWVRILEMNAVIVLKDKNLHRIYIACSNEVKYQQLQEMISGKTGRERLADSLIPILSARDISREEILSVMGKIENKHFEFIPEGKLVWIGLPWFGYELYSWYEDSRDDDNPEIDPHRLLYLGERTWDYSRTTFVGDEKIFIEEWGVDTADPIQVTPKLVVSAEIMNPQKSLFNVKYFQEAIQKEVLTAWKKAVQTLHYFTYTSQDETKEQSGNNKNLDQPTGVDKNLQTGAQKKLTEFLGLPNDDEIKNEPSKQLPGNYKSGTPARMIYDVYGIWLKRVQIRDIDPTDISIRESLQEKLRAQTKAVAEVEKAKGTRDATKKKADGEAYEIKKKGSAVAYAEKAKFVAKAEGLNSISKKLKLTPAENQLLLTTEMTVKLAEEAQFVYLTGEPGSLGTQALAAVDILKGRLSEVKTGTKKEAKISIEEIKKAWEGFPEEQRNELKGLLETLE